MSIYDIPEIVKIALPRATTPENIIAGFKMSGIYPFDMHVITDSDFLPSAVTDRPDPAISNAHSTQLPQQSESVQISPGSSSMDQLRNSIENNENMEHGTTSYVLPDVIEPTDFSPQKFTPFQKLRQENKQIMVERNVGVLF